MDNSLIERLIDKYKDYEQSSDFIHASIECFKHRKGDFTKNFIENTFRNNTIKDCNTASLNKLIQHWNKVSASKLDNGDYDNFYYSVITASNLKIVCHYLENRV